MSSQYAVAQINEWPTTPWIEPNGATANLVATTIGTLLALLANQLSLVAAGQRLPSSTGLLIDAWAADFFGSNLPRFPNEPDSAYIARIIDALSPTSCTLAAIAAKTQAFLVLQATFGQAKIFALDTSGSLDTFGALDTAGTVSVIPIVTAFDRQSDPARSAIVNLQPGQVCVLFSYPGITQQGFILGQAVLGTSALISSAIQIVSAPIPALDTYVRNFIKSAGIDIVYCDNRTA